MPNKKRHPGRTRGSRPSAMEEIDLEREQPADTGDIPEETIDQIGQTEDDSIAEEERQLEEEESLMEEEELPAREAERVKEATRKYRTAMYDRLRDSVKWAAECEIAEADKYNKFIQRDELMVFEDDGEDNGVSQDLDMLGMRQ